MRHLIICLLCAGLTACAERGSGEGPGASVSPDPVPGSPARVTVSLSQGLVGQLCAGPVPVQPVTVECATGDAWCGLETP